MYGGTFTFQSDGGGKSCNPFFHGSCPAQASVKIQYGNLEYRDTLINFQKHCKQAGIYNPLLNLPNGVTELKFNNHYALPSYYCGSDNQYCDTAGNIKPFEDLDLPIEPFINVIANLATLVSFSNEQALDNNPGYFPVHNSTNTFSFKR